MSLLINLNFSNLLKLAKFKNSEKQLVTHNQERLGN